MKTKLFILLLLFFGVVNARHRTSIDDPQDSKEYTQLKKTPAPLTPIKPEYPQTAKLAGIQGKVYVEVSIDEKGNVTETKILKSEQDALNTSACEAIKKTKFSPGISKENKKVKSKVVVPISFKLDDKPKTPGVETNVPSPVEISDPDINTYVAVEKHPDIIDAAKPEYPAEAKANKITGKVFVKVLISKEGLPKKAVVIKSDSQLLNQPAVDAAMKSKFSPALQEGKPVAVWVVLPYRFTLDGEEKGLIDNFDSIEAAKTEFENWIKINSSKREAKEHSVINERVDTDIQCGDESAIFKLTDKNIEQYGLFIRKGKTLYRYFGKSLDEIRGYASGFNEKNK